ncbi:MAG: hypothetical protein WAW53_02620 [Candidatus Dormiibacterota bacterium]
MIRRFLAGLLLVAGGAVIAVGVSQNWATLPATGQTLNGFTMGSTSIDAVVSFAVAGALMLIGLTMVLRGGAISRGLGFLCSLLAMVWAGGIVFLMSSAIHDIDHLIPAVSLVRHLQLGYFLVAGGAVLGFLGGLVGLTVPRRAAKKVAQVTTRPIPREKAAVPIADRAAMRGVAWGPAEGSSGGSAAPVDSRTPAEVGSHR